MSKWKKWLPTNKWWNGTLVTAATIVLMFWTGDGLDTDDEKTIFVGLILQRAVAYVTRNERDSRDPQSPPVD